MSSHAARFVVGPVLLVVFAAALWFDHGKQMHLLLWALCGAFCCVGLLEFYQLCSARGHKPAAVAGITVFVLSLMMRPIVEGPLFRPFQPSDLVVRPWIQFAYAFLPWGLAGWVAVKAVVRHPDFSPVDALLTLAGAAYVGLVHFLPPIWDEPRMLLFLLVTNKGSDIAAYMVGSTIGRHKMAPRVSPGKTWEGAVAGLLAGGAGGVFLMSTTPGAWLIASAALITIAGQMGDLFESAIKRWAGAKDSGAFLPGLGGALDVMDSFLLSVPLTYLLLRLPV